jgi:hypothetical protein
MTTQTPFLDAKVWGPWYWGFLHTATMTYPMYPNAATQKKYYDLINNFPLFIPVESMSKEFSRLLQKYPVTPYLDKRESLIRYMHFIHNKVNERLEKPKISLTAFYEAYYQKYKPKTRRNMEWVLLRQKLVFAVVFLALCGTIYYLYHK